MIVMLLDLCLAINALDLKNGQIFITKFNISNLALSKIVLRVKLNFLTFMFIPLSSHESRSINAYGRCLRQVLSLSLFVAKAISNGIRLIGWVLPNLPVHEI